MEKWTRAFLWLPFVIAACVSLEPNERKERAYADDIMNLLNQATETCSQAEATAGQSFGCRNFGSMYSSMPPQAHPTGGPSR